MHKDTMFFILGAHVAVTKESGDKNLVMNSTSIALSDLIEDKEIAAKAVAMVINGSRRGVVSLCADVADMLKHQKK